MELNGITKEGRVERKEIPLLRLEARQDIAKIFEDRQTRRKSARGRVESQGQGTNRVWNPRSQAKKTF